MLQIARSARLISVSTLMLLSVACSAKDTPPPADSTGVSAFRSEADSLAEAMARELVTTGARTGTWSSADASSTWTARMQGDQVVVIEEQLTFGESGAASRAFFFDPTGTLEQVSEQRSQRVLFPDRSPAEQLTVTVLEFTVSPPNLFRTVDGKPGDIQPYEVDAFRAHAAELVAAARKAAPPPSTP